MGKTNHPSKVINDVAIVTALSLLGDSMLYVALPLYWEQAGLDSIWQVGILLSINRFIRLPANPFVGWIYKRISLKTGLLTAIIIGSITTLGYGLFNGFAAWIILRSLWGIAWSFFRIGGLTSVAYYAEESHRGKAMGTYNGLYRLGSLFGMLLGGIFIPVIGLDAVSIIFGLSTLAGIPIILYTLKGNEAGSKTEHTTDKPKTYSASRFVKNRILFICTTGFFITMLFQGVLTSTLSSVIEYHYGEFISLFHIVLSVALLSGILQSIRWVWEPFLGRTVGILSDGPKGRLPFFILSLFLTGLVFGMISFDGTIGLWIITTLLVMAGATVLTTLTDAIAMDISRSGNTVSFLTLYTIIQDIGAAAGPFIGYMIIELKSGYAYLYWGGSGLFFLLAFLWLIIHLSEKKQQLGRVKNEFNYH
ncbi:MFS transporter [Oceanobacillus massiliensis]|uniref:MFS transporter n=1 Tax=Oceanobacillus massiliensis TaxID=1465765 RepID=UPI000289826C|nr:MFS transporter [Oceanobacillus massiliensis]